MDKSCESILNDAMQLPVEQRALIADALRESIHPTDPEVEEAWSDEIAQRLRDIDEGKVEMLEGETVMKELRKWLDDGCPR